MTKTHTRAWHKPYGPPSHTTCRHCRRLLAPQPDGTLPRHRTPPKHGTYPCATQPLTGSGQPWCKGSDTR